MEGLGKGVKLYQSGKERQNDLFEGLHAAIRGPNLKHPCISAIILGWIVFGLAFFLLDILLHLVPNTVVLLLLTILPASLGNTAVYTRMKWNLEVVEEMEGGEREFYDIGYK